MRTERGKRGDLDTVLIRDDGADSLLELAPARGGIATRLRIRGNELLFLDESTLHDFTKNVRGGIPICFPIAGKLPGDHAEFAGKRIHLTQHGFARRSPWSVVDDVEHLTILLSSSDATRAEFPFEFEARVTYRLVGNGLSVESAITNKGDGDLPVHIGFHPYFQIPANVKGHARIEVAATESFDNRTSKVLPYIPPALGLDEVDLHILDPRGGAARLVAPGRPTIRLDYGGFPMVVVWTLPEKDFVCVEPWSAPAGAMATGQGLRRLAPGATDWRTWFVEAEL